MNRNPLNMKLYEKAKKEADKVYKRHSLYKSAYIQKLYRDMGGEYDKPKNYDSGIERWFKERWINFGDYIRYGTIVPCGKGEKNKACRPFYKVSEETPITANELLLKYPKTKLLKAINKKEKNMDIRINWNKI